MSIILYIIRYIPDIKPSIELKKSIESNLLDLFNNDDNITMV